jgi:hypothetical protein
MLPVRASLRHVVMLAPLDSNDREPGCSHTSRPDKETGDHSTGATVLVGDKVKVGVTVEVALDDGV